MRSRTHKPAACKRKHHGLAVLLQRDATAQRHRHRPRRETPKSHRLPTQANTTSVTAVVRPSTARPPMARPARRIAGDGVWFVRDSVSGLQLLATHETCAFRVEALDLYRYDTRRTPLPRRAPPSGPCPSRSVLGTSSRLSSAASAGSSYGAAWGSGASLDVREPPWG
ncbi:hypothetical protein PG987_005940 [Apiospora arundinis]